MEQTQEITLIGESLKFTRDIVVSVYNVIFYNIMKVVRSFVERLKYIVPNETDDALTYEAKKELLQEVRAILQSPEFQKEWNAFSKSITNIVRELSIQLRSVIDEELGEMTGTLVDMVETNTSNLVKGIGMGIMDGICSVPPLGVICELSQIAQTSTELGIETFRSFLKTTNHAVKAYEKIIGETAIPIAEQIQSVINFLNYINNTASRIQSKFENLDQLGAEGIQTLRKQLPNVNTASRIQSKFENIGQLGEQGVQTLRKQLPRHIS